MHVAICGTTMSGKSYAAKKLAERARRAGKAVLVLDPMRDTWTSATWQTDDSARFLDIAQRARNCLLICDETGSSIGRREQGERMQWLATQSRHCGHSCIFVMQRPTQVLPIIRENCGAVFLYNCSESTAAIWAECFNDDGLLDASQLNRFQYLYKKRFQSIKKGKF